MKLLEGQSRQMKVIFGIVATFVGLIFLFVLYSYLNADKGANSRIAPAANSTNQKKANATETEQYNKQLTDFNEKNAESAVNDGKSYLSIPSLYEEKVEAQPIETVANTNNTDDKSELTSIRPKPTPAQSQQTAQQTQNQKDAAYKAAAEMLKTKIKQFESPSLANVIGDNAYTNQFLPVEETKAKNTTNNANAASSSVSLSTLQQAEPVQLVEAFSKCPASLDMTLDTDVNSIVGATLWCSELKGAKVYASGYQRVGENIDMTFTTLVMNGKRFNIVAKPVDTDTGRTMLAGDVNNRYMSRIIAPALAGGIARAGQLYEQAIGNEVTVSNGTVIETRSNKVSARQLQGTFAAGIAEQTANVLIQDASAIPPIQITRDAQTSLQVMFVEPIYSTDVIDDFADKRNGQSAINPTTQQPTPLAEAQIMPIQAQQ